jgi:hypothetical protein
MPPSTPEADQVRASARAAGMFRESEVGWVGRLARERLRIAAKHPRVEPFEGPDLARVARGERLIRGAARRAAVAGCLAATGASAGEVATLVTEGLGGTVAVPAALASVGLETIYLARLYIDLACDVAALYGVHFDPEDLGELVGLVEIAVGPGASGPAAAKSFLVRLLAPPDREVLGEFARGLARTASVGLVPVVGVPLSADRNHAQTRQLGERIHQYMQCRRAVRETLSRVLGDPSLDKALLLEGAWLLVTCDEVVTHEEVSLLAAVVRAIPVAQRPAADCLHFVGEGAWVFRMAFVPDATRRRVLGALLGVAALRGSTGEPERAFFARVGEALQERLDLRRIDAIRRDLNRGVVPPASDEP